MKIISFLLVLVVGGQVLAATTKRSVARKATTTSTVITEPIDTNSPYTLEPSISFSSLNSGSQFLSVALTSRFNSWFTGGVEGDLPMSFQDDAQVFEAKAFGRFHFLNDVNKVYAQVATVLGLFSQATIGNEVFLGGEVMVGYARPVHKNWLIGGRMGAQIINYNYNRNAEIYNNDVFATFNRFTFYTSYVF